jgi:hypothetical protein
MIEFNEAAAVEVRRIGVGEIPVSRITNVFLDP